MDKLKDKEHTKNNDYGVPTQMYYKKDVKEAILKYLEYKDDLMYLGSKLSITEFHNKWHHGEGYKRNWTHVFKDIFGEFKE